MLNIPFSAITHILTGVGGAVVGGVIGEKVGRARGQNEMNPVKISTQHLTSFRNDYNKAVSEVVEYVTGLSGSESNAWSQDLLNAVELPSSGEKSFSIPQVKSHNFNKVPHRFMSEQTKELIDRLNAHFLGYFQHKGEKEGEEVAKDMSNVKHGVQWQLNVNPKVTDEAVIKWNAIYHLVMECVNYTVSLAQLAARKSELIEASTKINYQVGGGGGKNISSSEEALNELSIQAISDSANEAYNLIKLLLLACREHLAKHKTAFGREIIGGVFGIRSGRERYIDGLLNTNLLQDCVQSMYEDAEKHIHLLYITEAQKKLRVFELASRKNLKLLAEKPLEADRYIHECNGHNVETLLTYIVGGPRDRRNYSLTGLGKKPLKEQYDLLMELYTSAPYGSKVGAPTLDYVRVPGDVHKVKSSGLSNDEKNTWRVIYELGVGIDLRKALREINNFVYSQFIEEGKPGRDQNLIALMELSVDLANMLMIVSIGQGNTRRLDGIVASATEGRGQAAALVEYDHGSVKKFGRLCPNIKYKGSPEKQHRKKGTILQELHDTMKRAEELLGAQNRLLEFISLSCTNQKMAQYKAYEVNKPVSQKHYEVVLRATLAQFRAATLVGDILQNCASNKDYLKEIIQSKNIRRAIDIYLSDQELKSQPFGFVAAQQAAASENHKKIIDAILSKSKKVYVEGMQVSGLGGGGKGTTLFDSIKNEASDKQLKLVEELIPKCMPHGNETVGEKTTIIANITGIISDMHSAWISPSKDLQNRVLYTISQGLIRTHSFIENACQKHTIFGLNKRQMQAVIEPSIERYYYKDSNGDFYLDLSKVGSITCLAELGSEHLSMMMDEMNLKGLDAIKLNPTSLLDSLSPGLRSNSKLRPIMLEPCIRKMGAEKLFNLFDKFDVNLGINNWQHQTTEQKVKLLNEQSYSKLMQIADAIADRFSVLSSASRSQLLQEIGINKEQKAELIDIIGQNVHVKPFELRELIENDNRSSAANYTSFKNIAKAIIWKNIQNNLEHFARAGEKYNRSPVFSIRLAQSVLGTCNASASSMASNPLNMFWQDLLTYPVLPPKSERQNYEVFDDLKYLKQEKRNEEEWYERYKSIVTEQIERKQRESARLNSVILDLNLDKDSLNIEIGKLDDGLSEARETIKELENQLSKASKQTKGIKAGFDNVLSQKQGLVQDMFATLSENADRWHELIDQTKNSCEEQIEMIRDVLSDNLEYLKVEQDDRIKKFVDDTYSGLCVKNPVVRKYFEDEFAKWEEKYDEHGGDVWQRREKVILRVVDEKINNFFNEKKENVREHARKQLAKIESDCQKVVSSLEKNRDDLKAKIEDFRVQNNVLKGKVKKLLDKINEHSETLGRILNGFQILKNELSNVKKDVANLRDSVEGLTKKWQDVFEQFLEKSEKELEEQRKEYNQKLEQSIDFPFQIRDISDRLDSKVREDKVNAMKAFTGKLQKIWIDLKFDSQRGKFVGEEYKAFLDKFAMFVLVASLPRFTVTVGKVTSSVIRLVEDLRGKNEIILSGIIKAIVEDANRLIQQGIPARLVKYLNDRVCYLNLIEKYDSEYVADGLRWWALVHVKRFLDSNRSDDDSVAKLISFTKRVFSYQYLAIWPIARGDDQVFVKALRSISISEDQLVGTETNEPEVLSSNEEEYGATLYL